jgi:hypothetical protein
METYSNKDELEKTNTKDKIIFKKSFYGDYYVYDINYFDNKFISNNFLKEISKSYIDYNEVLTNNTRRKIYFDIDYTYDKIEEMIQSRDKFVKNFETDFKKYILHIDNYVNVDDIKIIFMDASGYTKEKQKYKLSLHIIISNYGYFLVIINYQLL